MKRRIFLLATCAALAAPGPALAQTAETQVVDQLKRQGFDRIRIGRTLLGRTRIVATGPSGRREIILNPSTGAILRDYVDRSGGDDSGDGNKDPEDSSNSGSGENDDDDDDNSGSGSGKDDDEDNSGRGNSDDENDDDDDDDNSGSGGGGSDDSSGSGGGGDDDNNDDHDD